MIFLLRGAYANEFELQNYAPLMGKMDIKVVTTPHPMTDIQLEGIPLWSPTELPQFAFRRQILNRLVGGEHWLSGLDKIIKKDDIVHTAETYYPYTHQAVELRKQGKVAKLICTCWETIPHANEKLGQLRKWKQEAYKYVDLFHTPTERAKHALVSEGVDPRKILVIPYGVDLSRFIPAKHKVNERPLVLTVARLEKEKGMEDINMVAQMLPQYDFLVIGKGSYRFTSKNVTTLSVPYAEIHELYQSADLFFLPSRTTKTWEEQYGMALVEAMACGLPIVTTRSGAIPEVVGNAAVLVPEKNVEKMAQTIQTVLSNPDAKRKLTRLSLARAKSRYDAKKVAEKLAKLYEK